MAISSFDSYTNSRILSSNQSRAESQGSQESSKVVHTCSTELEGSTCTVSWSHTRQGHLTGDFHDPPTMTGIRWKWGVGGSPFLPIALTKLHAKPGLKDYSHGGSLKKESVWLQSGLRNGLFTCWGAEKKCWWMCCWPVVHQSLRSFFMAVVCFPLSLLLTSLDPQIHVDVVTD